MITVGQARNDTAILNAANYDAADPRVVKEIDRAQRLVLGWGNWTDSVQEYCFTAVNGCIFLPPEIQSIQQVQVLGAASSVFDQSFTYLDNGPRSVEGAAPGVIDRGPAVTFTQPTCPTSVMLVADSCERLTDAWVNIVARDQAGRVITTEQDGAILPYLRLPLVDGRTFPYPVNNIMFVDQITKPLTAGAVHIFEYNVETHNVGNLIASLAPHDTTPAWRRYEVTGCCGNARVRVLAKRKHAPLYHDEQALMIDDLDAIALAIKHAKASDAGELDKASYFENAARARLALREKEIRGPSKPRVEFAMPVVTTKFRRLRR